MSVDAQVPNGVDELFLRIVTETPALDDLRILYDLVSFSSSSAGPRCAVGRAPDS